MLSLLSIYQSFNKLHKCNTYYNHDNKMRKSSFLYVFHLIRIPKGLIVRVLFIIGLIAILKEYICV